MEARAPWRRLSLSPFAGVLSGLALVSALFGWHLFPLLATDEAYFKGVSYHLAVEGRWANPFAAGLYPGIENAFVPYPPLFLVGLAGWFELLGFGPHQNHAFVLLLQWGTALVAGLLVMDLARDRQQLWGSLAAIGVYGYERLDRPDPLAALLVLTTILCMSRPRARWLVAPAALGTLLVVPAATVVYGAAIAVVLARSGLSRRTLARLAVFTGAGVLAAAAALRTASPDLFWLFARQCRDALFFRFASLDRLSPEALVPPGVGRMLPWLVLFVGFTFLVRVWPRRELPRRVTALLDATAASMLAWFFLTSGKHIYLLLCAPLAAIAILAATSHLEGRARGAALAAAFVCLVSGGAHQVLDVARCFALAPEDEYRFTAEAVRRVIPPGSAVAADASLWTMFAGDYEYRDAHRGSGLDGVIWLASTGFGTGRPGLSSFERRHPDLAAGYELVYDSLLPEPQRLLGIPLGHTRLGYGIRIFRRRDMLSTSPSTSSSDPSR